MHSKAAHIPHAVLRLLSLSLLLYVSVWLRPAWAEEQAGAPSSAPSASSAQGVPTGPASASLLQQAGAVIVTRLQPVGGDAQWTPAGQQPSRRLEVGQSLQRGDLISTGPEVWVQLLFVPACRVWIAPNSRILVGNLGNDSENLSLELLLGRVRATFGSLLGDVEERFSITAESVFAAPRGTDFTVERLPSGGLIVQVVEGEVAVGNRAGEGLRLPVGRAVEVQLSGSLSPVSRPLKLEPEKWTPPASVWLGRGALPLTVPAGSSALPGAAQIELPLTPPLALPPTQPWVVELKP
ncbi:MAG: FecR domain-containing protein [Myxococcota bacterium]